MPGVTPSGCAAMIVSLVLLIGLLERVVGVHAPGPWISAPGLFSWNGLVGAWIDGAARRHIGQGDADSSVGKEVDKHPPHFFVAVNRHISHVGLRCAFFPVDHMPFDMRLQAGL